MARAFVRRAFVRRATSARVALPSRPHARLYAQKRIHSFESIASAHDGARREPRTSLGARDARTGARARATGWARPRRPARVRQTWSV